MLLFAGELLARQKVFENIKQKKDTELERLRAELVSVKEQQAPARRQSPATVVGQATPQQQPGTSTATAAPQQKAVAPVRPNPPAAKFAFSP